LAAVRHLIELGYEDPEDAVRRERSIELQLRAELAEAEARVAAGRFPEAIASLEGLARAAPEWAPARRLLAVACYRAGRLTSALVHLDWLEDHAVEHAHLALLRAMIELSRRRLDAALDQASYARHLDASLPGPDAVIGEASLRRGDLEAAEAAFQRAAELAPGDAGPLSGRAAVALRRGDYEAAIDLSLRALELNMEAPLAHYRLGAALAMRRQSREARVALETFARLSPHVAAPCRWLATVCTAMGDDASASEYQQRGRLVIRQRRARRGGTGDVDAPPQANSPTDGP
jgi:Flp pilus assembly protein TadD